MLITKVELENIKSYKRATVTLMPGTTAISGHNGAGKTTIVEAIGYALFDYLPISHKAFVREGEKFGIVTVSLISALDDREYQVVRRCGSNPAYYVYDRHLDLKVVEQKTDVSDWLKKHLRVENGSELTDVFCNALGVPQGTFTADFLATPAARKKKFDDLLRVEEYRLATESLLAVRSLISTKLATIKSRDHEISLQTEKLPQQRDTLARLVRELQEKTDLLLDISTHSKAEEGRKNDLDVLKKQVEQASTDAERTRQSWEHQITLYEQASKRLEESQLAAEQVRRHYADHDLYLQAEAELHRLEKLRQARDQAHKRYTEAQHQVDRTAQKIENFTHQLEDIACARQEWENLVPLVLQQQALETEEQVILLQNQRLQAAQTTRAKLDQELAGLTQRETQVTKEIAVAESRRVEADQYGQLQGQLLELTGKKGQLKNLLANKQKLEKELTEASKNQEIWDTRVSKLQRDIAKVETVQAEAQALPELEEQIRRLERDLAAVESALKTNAEARVQSKGGMCPLLHEPCLNIARSGIKSLEDYFDNLIRHDQAQQRELVAMLAQLGPQVERVRQIQKYVEKLDGWNEQITEATTQEKKATQLVSTYQAELRQSQIEFEALAAVDTELPKVKVALTRSEAARKLVNNVELLERNLLELQATLATRRLEHAQAVEEQQRLAEAPRKLLSVREQLNQLNNPRQQSALLSGRIQQAPHLQTQLHTAQQTQEENLQRLAIARGELDQELFAGLDAALSSWQDKRDGSKSGHHIFLKHEQVATRLPTDQQEAGQRAGQAKEAKDLYKQAGERLTVLSSRFDEAEYDRIVMLLQELDNKMSTLHGELLLNKNDQDKASEEITRLIGLEQELARLRKEGEELEELEVMLAFFRNTIKEAGPYVMKALLQKISLNANTIFGEIMGDRTHQLRWDDDYEVILRHGGHERRFTQLSGGEQMSAALALRLGLLKELSNLDIAFFDEPTQNMDDNRRGNLAEQIRRVKGFSQLVVISHDDTFEYGLDSIIHLKKESGETVIIE